MAIIKRIVCLANSRKLQGRCIAGKELQNGCSGEWVRPVSDREKGEVSEYERQYSDGSDPRVLDIIDVPLLSSKPENYQQENWLLNRGDYWVKIDIFPRNELHRFIDQVAPLWINRHSTYHGRNDRIPLELAKSLTNSLSLIQVDYLWLFVFKPYEAFGDQKRRVQARFQHAGDEYRLWVTDPLCERDYLAKKNGKYEIGKSFLTVSLGEPYQGNCYKLVAAIIPSHQAGAS